jgi:hypothetical protein
MASLAMILVAVTGSSGEDFKGKIAKIMARPSSAPGKTVVTIYFRYPIESRGSNPNLSCIDSGDHSVQISDNNSNMPISTVNQILSLALTAYTTGSSFALDVDGSASGGPCANGVWGYILN